MNETLADVLRSYDPGAPLGEAWTLPAPFYLDPRIADLERRAVFGHTWQVVGRADQVREPGRYLSADVAGEPIVVVRGQDGVLRGFFNVCRHHAAQVITEPEGQVKKGGVLRCPYHGWTYGLDGQLRGTPDFAGVCNFIRSQHGLVPVHTEVWEQWVLVKLDPSGPALFDFLSAGLVAQIGNLGLSQLRFVERCSYTLECNWKVFVDNYLDGGYHVPHLHKGLGSVLDYSQYIIETGDRFCLQSSPLTPDQQGAEVETGAVRRGDRARYYWIYPNFMINCYEGVMDTNLVIPRGVDRTEVIFDFYFADTSEAAMERNRASIKVCRRIQEEDVGICKSVQRGLSSRAYVAGRLSVRREGGEHLFHRLLHADLSI